MNEPTSDLWKVVNLRQITLTRLDARCAWTPEALPEALPKLVLNHAARGRDLPDRNTIEVFATMSVTAVDGAEAKDAPLFIEATYRILYERPPERAPTAEEVQEFASRNGVFNAWPYWRELSHSMYGRMEIPLPPVPVFRVSAGLHGASAENAPAGGESE